MTELVVRRLLVDLETPIPARWNGGDAFRSAFFNALSMSFPVGEQFFIDSVRAVLDRVPPPQRDALAQEVRGFIGQEATHRRIHGLFNDHLTRQGYRNTLEPRVKRRIASHAHLDARIHLGVTAATEHITAIFAEWMMRHPEALAGTESRLVTLWMWHAAEESEHRSTAFDLYRAVGGDERWRRRLMFVATWHFAVDISRQTLRNLWHDGSWWRAGTWASAWRLLFTRDGMVRGNARRWCDYLRPTFHPSQGEVDASARWLDQHRADYRVVGEAATGA